MQKTHAQWLLQMIESDSQMMVVLSVVRDLNLKDGWIGSGFVRNKVWNELHDLPPSFTTDIDVIYFDIENAEPHFDAELEQKLLEKHPHLQWSIKNQARMHIRNGHSPYISTEDAISYWPETATAIAVRLNSENQLEYLAPYGLEDLFNLVVAPTLKTNAATYNSRLKEKAWQQKWRDLKVLL